LLGASRRFTALMEGPGRQMTAMPTSAVDARRLIAIELSVERSD
jgi:hypothetical protein